MALIILFLGFLNYVFFQNDIVLFKLIGVHPFKSFPIPSRPVRLFFTGYFSDMAWCISLCLTVLVFSELNYFGFYGKIATLALPILTELLQQFGIVYGFFDWYDIAIYTAIILFFIPAIFNLKRNCHEKN